MDFLSQIKKLLYLVIILRVTDLAQYNIIIKWT